MPKAESASRSSSLTKGSPIKRSYGVPLPPLVHVPYGVPSNKVKVAPHWIGKRKEEPPKTKPPLFVTSIRKGEPPKGIFLSDDIFAEQAEVESGMPDHPDDSTALPNSPEPMDEDGPDFNMDDLKEALNDSILSSGLEELPELDQAKGGGLPQDNEDYFLRTNDLDNTWIPEIWKSFSPPQFGYFKKISLQQIGLQVPLGHSGSICPKSHASDEYKMTIFHINGHHRIRFRKCCCGNKDLWELLLEAGIFPATEKSPQTGFTIALLRHQRACSLRGKTSLKEYFDMLVQLTDSAEGQESVPNLYNQFRDVVRQYRVLLMLIRAGKSDGNDPLRRGELCVTCPACPAPGENLPPNWQDDPLKQLHYARFLSGDGNFKLQRVARKSNSIETPLHHRSMLGDAGFWVPEETLIKYLNNSMPSSDEGTSPLKLYAPTRLLTFAWASGPLNSSYQSGLRYFVVTYDIACKYGVNFKKRCCDTSCNFVLIPTAKGEMYIAFCVNKFHQESHDDNCGARNSLNYTKFVGRTCGEGVETVWAKLNWLRSSTREMNPGMRIEVLSEHFNDWNWQKILSIAQQQLEELKLFLGDAEVSRLQSQYDTLGGEKFYEDPTKVTWLSRIDLLAEGDKAASGPGIHPMAARNADVDQVNFICKALQLEANQAKLIQRQHDLARMRDPIPALKAQVSILKEELQDGLAIHYELLRSVSPQLDSLGLSPEAPETDEICLPSRFTAEEVKQYGLEELLKVEIQIRTGFAYDAIHELRRGLSLRSFWSKHITNQLQTQTKGTKGQTSLQTANARVKDAMRTYDVCWRWLDKVAPASAKSFGLRKLNQSDILLLSDWQEGKMYKRSNKRLPWFWTLRPQPSTSGDDKKDQSESDEPISKLEQALEAWRSEFERWVEEVAIIGREMAATCRSFQHRAMVWSERASQAFEASKNDDIPWEAQPSKVRGYIAYASRQFDLYTWLADSAYATFETTVGQRNWAEIWRAPSAQNQEK
ncbi:hypothetical protein FRC01_004157 [Tulasnella sp. 417]|nr:hypothetical protein FRC01_004157 [Tulasnella sp. 417]